MHHDNPLCKIINDPSIVTGSIHENLKYFDTLHSSHISHTIVKRGVQESNHPFNKIKEVTFKTLGK